MRVTKAGSASAESGGELEMAAVNAFAKAQLRPEDVYIFSVLLCDNEVDRDFERFTEKTLGELAELFVGKTGICDHDWKTENQVARIYRTEVITEGDKLTSFGEPYRYLKGHAYMLRTAENEPLIAAVEGGIKKETSVGVSVARSVCSICGQELGGAGCSHVKGEEYGGKLCFAQLDGAVDAYEWSFVAVPAQKNAGVIKKFGGGQGLEAFVKTAEGGAFAGEYGELSKQAAVGKRCMDQLRGEVMRLGGLCGGELYAAVKNSVAGMDGETLLDLKTALEKKSLELFPPVTQLPGANAVTAFDGSEYKI
jgi:hypothetical protein